MRSFDDLTAWDLLIIQGLGRRSHFTIGYAFGTAADRDAEIMRRCETDRQWYGHAVRNAVRGMPCDLCVPGALRPATPSRALETVSEAVTAEGCVVISSADETGTYVTLQGLDHE